MSLNIDNLLPAQQPVADQDIAVQWGEAVEADLRSHEVKVSSMALGGPSITSYVFDTNTDSGWAGNKINCVVYGPTGNLHPILTEDWDGVDLWDGLSEWGDAFVAAYQYTTLPVDFGNVYTIEGQLTVNGYFPGGVAITAQQSLDGVNWEGWPSTQAGTTVTLSQANTRHVRFILDVTQDGTSPNYISALQFNIKGPQYWELLPLTIPLSGAHVVFNRPYYNPPAVLFTPLFLAGIDLIPRITNVTATGCTINLVKLDGTPLNGAGACFVVSS